MCSPLIPDYPEILYVTDKGDIVKVSKKVKLSLLQAMEAHRVARG
jgi:hypothetical protein